MKKYAAYSKYKSSGIEWLGDIPAYWEIKRLKYNFFLKTKKAVTDLNPIALENIASWTGNFIETASEFEGEGVAFEKGDILFGKLRPYLAKVFLSETSGEAIGDLFVMSPQRAVYAKYAAYVLRTRDFIEIVDGSTYGSKMPRASWEFLGGLPFLLPPLSEQQAIAEFLDRETGKIDLLLSKREKLIELMQEKRSALISHAVTKGLNPNAKMKPSGIDWLGDIPEHWIMCGLKHRMSSVVDYRGKTPEKLDDGIFLVTARNIKDGYIDYSASQEYVSIDEYEDIMSRGLPHLGDVLLTTEAPLGNVAQIDNEKIALAQRVIKFSGHPSCINNHFLYYLMLSGFFKSQLDKYATGSTALGIKAERFCYLKILIPTLDEQLEITEFLDRETGKIDSLIEKEKIIIEKLREYRSALISEAVTGKIDVRK